MNEQNMSPGEAIHHFCVQCVGGSAHDVKRCGGERCKNGGCDKNGVCWFLKYRMGEGRPSVKLIRKYCLYCCDGDALYVRHCPNDATAASMCALYPFRMARNPNIVLSDEQKAARAKNFQGKEGMVGEKTP